MTADPTPAPRSVADTDTRGDVALLVLAVGTLALALLLQTRDTHTVMIPWLDLPLPSTCWTRRFLSLDCPGCGLTRSFIRLAHGDLLGAWNFHPIGPLMFALVAAQIPWRTWQIWRGRSGRGRWQASFWAYVPLASIIVLMFGRWFVRLFLGDLRS